MREGSAIDRNDNLQTWCSTARSGGRRYAHTLCKHIHDDLLDMRYPSYARATQGLSPSDLNPSDPPGPSVDVLGGKTDPEDVTDGAAHMNVSTAVEDGDERREQRESRRRIGKGRGWRVVGEAAKQRNSGTGAPRPSQIGASCKVPLDAAGFKRELEALRKELDSTKDLLRIRSEELRGIQAFLNTADKVPLAEILRTVEKLNAEIFQLSAVLADSFTYASEIPVGESKEENRAWFRLRDAGSACIAGLHRVSCGPFEHGMGLRHHAG